MQFLVIARKIIVLTKKNQYFLKSCFKASNLLKKKTKKMFLKQLAPSVNKKGKKNTVVSISIA